MAFLDHEMYNWETLQAFVVMQEQKKSDFVRLNILKWHFNKFYLLRFWMLVNLLLMGL